MIPPRFRVPGRPPKERAAMARALVAKAVYDCHRSPNNPQSWSLKTPHLDY